MTKGLFFITATTAEEMRAAVLQYLQRQGDKERASLKRTKIGVRDRARAEGRADMCRDALAFFTDLTIQPAPLALDTSPGAVVQSDSDRLD